MGAVPQRYFDFFTDCLTNGEKNILCMGGRRSAKTISTFKYFDEFGQAVGGLEFVVVCNEFAPLQRTMQDYTLATNCHTHGNLEMGYVSQCGANQWQFVHFDSNEKAQGTKGDILFVNEALNVKPEVIDTCLLGTKFFAVYNFNPTKRTAVMDKVNAGETNLLKTTFKDNPYLTENQLAYFEELKARAMRPNATKRDIYLYNVYYLGNFDTMAGGVFTNVERCTFAEFQNVPATEVNAIDFGFATDGDPTTMVGVKVWRDKIYVHEYIYEKGLTSDKDLALRLRGCGINERTLLLGDYGGMGRGRMQKLRTGGNGEWSGDIARGFNICNAIKTNVEEGVSRMLTRDAIVITEDSVNTRNEFENYEFTENNKPKGEDHAIDAVRYAYTYIDRMALATA